MGRWHAHALTHAGHTVVAVVDSNLDRAATIAQTHAGARAFATLAESSDADVVHVCTPLGTHVSLALEAIARGSHVIVEKPLAITPEETSRVIESATSARVLVVPVHQFPFQRGVIDAQQSMPTIGAVLHVDFTACTAGAAGKSDAEQDRLAREVLPHPMSLLARLIAPEISTIKWEGAHTRPGELRANGVLGGASVSVVVSTHGRPTTNQMRIIGEHGTIAIDLYHGFSVATHGRATRTGKVAQPFVNAASQFGAAAGNLVKRAAARESAYPGLRELVRAFYDAVSDGTPAPISTAETMAVANAVAHVEQLMERV